MITLCVWCAQNLTLDANHTRAAVLYGELQLSFHRQLHHGQLRSLTVWPTQTTRPAFSASSA